MDDSHKDVQVKAFVSLYTLKVVFKIKHTATVIIILFLFFFFMFHQCPSYKRKSLDNVLRLYRPDVEEFNSSHE